MTTLRLVVRHEWRGLLRDRTALVASAVFLAAAALALSLGTRWHLTEDARLTEVHREERARLSAMHTEAGAILAGDASAARFRDPTKASWVGEFLGTRSAVWPLAATSGWAIGQRDLVPGSFRVTTLGRESFIFDEDVANPAQLAAGRFDLAFVLVLLFPLVILATSADLVSGEREAGMLPMVLAQPVSLGTLVLGNVLARAVWLAALLAVIVTAGGLTSRALGWPVSWETALVWWLAPALMAAAWLAVAVIVGARAQRTGTAAGRLVALWLVTSVVVPGGLDTVASFRHPPPPRHELHERVRETSRTIAPRGRELLEDIYRERPEWRPPTEDVTDWAPGFYAAQQTRDQLIAPLFARHQDQVVAQQRFVDRWRWLSPPLVVHAVLLDVSGTGAPAAHRFMTEVVRYHEAWQAFFFPRIFRRASMTPSDYDAMPRFRYTPESEGRRRARVATYLAWLSGVTTLLVAVAHRRVRHARG